ncbi:MAG: hypothetical protein M3Y55_03495 [Pseudomonadota bacterium]|nr:hypothetical protein [Pseudomonadota bacterium]
MKFASGAAWNFVRFAYFDVKPQPEPFEAARLGGERWLGRRGQGSGSGWRDSAFPSMPATSFSGSPAPAGKDDNIKRLRSMLASAEAMRRGSEPIPESIAEALQADDMSIDECAEMLQSMIEDGLGHKATALGDSHAPGPERARHDRLCRGDQDHGGAEVSLRSLSANPSGTPTRRPHDCPIAGCASGPPSMGNAGNAA